MARRVRREPPTPTPIAKVGLAIAVAAFAAILALGFSLQTVEQGATTGGEPSTVACGSVFSPQDEPLCDETRSNRRNLMLLVGVPGVVVGLGMVIGSSRPAAGDSRR